MAQIILVSSNQVLLHSNDLLDQRVIQNNCFVPNYTSGSVPEAINEIVKLARYQLKNRPLDIEADVSYVRHLFPELLFDRRRLQQVLSNLLSNATKF